MFTELSRTSLLSQAKWQKIAILFSTLLLTIGCGEQQQAGPKAPPPAVSTYVIESDNIGRYNEFVARTAASKEVDLKARVEGELIERLFKEGSIVEQGQVLFRIDPAAYLASLASAKADLASRIAGAQGAERDLKRGHEVAGDGYISQSELDKLITNDSQARAGVSVAKASLEQAQLNLSYTTIKAPFSGRIGKAYYDIGNVVGPTISSLATLTAIDPIYVSFRVEESDFISYLQKNKNKNDKTALAEKIEISLRLPNNTEYPEPGRLAFADTKIEQGMGTVELRAVFANPDGIILPGLFVNLILESKEKKVMALVPQFAVQENQQGKFVLVIDENNKVVQRIVKLGRRINAMWLVESGIVKNERVIIEGLQKVRTGLEVKPINKRVDPLTGIISDFVAQ